MLLVCDRQGAVEGGAVVVVVVAVCLSLSQSSFFSLSLVMVFRTTAMLFFFYPPSVCIPIHLLVCARVSARMLCACVRT